MKRFIQEKKQIIIVAVVVLLTTVTTYAMTAEDFTDYSPPDYLYINWGDYLYNIGGVWKDSQAQNNAPSGNSRITVEYPYRAIFYGRTSASINDTRMFVVYSKKPVIDLFTFQYMGSDKTGKSGRIRAFVAKNKINNIDPYYPENNSEILILGYFGNGLDASTGVIVGAQPYPNFTVAVSSHGTQGLQAYFNFDFFYDCASEHQQGASDLNINDLTSISGVPYDYIIPCKDHTGYTGGGGSNPGGSNPDGSDPGGSLSGDKNNGGDGDRHGWGTGDYGGGVNKHKWDITSGNKELSVPDDWKKPHEDNYNSMPESEYQPDYPEYIPAEGDTGENGSNWELPEWGEDDGVNGEIRGYKNFDINGEYGLIDFMSPMEDWLK